MEKIENITGGNASSAAQQERALRKTSAAASSDSSLKPSTSSSDSKSELQDPELRKWIGKRLADRYEIVSVLGVGGMAVVYRAVDHRLNRSVAVKIMREDVSSDESIRSRFAAESHAVAMLSHPNIVAVYDVSHNDVVEYIVMELIDGVTLLQYIEKKGALPWHEALHFARQVAKALSHAHARGIIHRDIKPNNIMLLRDGTIKVADFGIAALENEMEDPKGEAIGSIHYISPEQARGSYPDPRSDVYSLGVVMFEMFTGRKPYLGESIREIAVKHMNAEPPSMTALNPSLPPELERITRKAMCASIEDRYQSANELVDDIDAFLRDRETVSPSSDEESVVSVPDELEISEQRRIRSQQLRKSGAVSWLSGSFFLLVAAVFLLVFVYRFWLQDLFSPAVRVTLPDFVGKNFESVYADPEMQETYSFKVVYLVNTETAPGTVLSQSPNPGRSIMMTPGGIEVRLSVSTGDTVASIPDVSNLDYRAATSLLRQCGLYIEVVNAASDTVEHDRVIRTEPYAGTEVTTASLVYVYVSCGTELRMLSVPNLIGLSEEAAISQIESNSFSYGWSDTERSDLAAGTVIGQSLDPFSTQEEHSMIYLTISSGPEEP